MIHEKIRNKNNTRKSDNEEQQQNICKGYEKEYTIDEALKSVKTPKKIDSGFTVQRYERGKELEQSQKYSQINPEIPCAESCRLD